MAKLSVIIPSRDEKFLTPTIDDIFRNARGEIEVIAVLDSDTWPTDWKEVTARHGNRLHTIHHGHPKGLRAAINSGVASAISRGAKYIAKFDGHCSFSEGFDLVLMSECDVDWIVVPRRGRLDPETWTATETHKPDIDYHYLSFPNDPNDFGGPGLNGKPWPQRAIERAQHEIDEEMSSQGSGWFMHAEYFTRRGFMDEASYGPFWNEMQELALCCWLSGGRVMVNKLCKYLHLHKGSRYGRGYRLDEKWLKQGRNHTMKWIFNEAYDQQTLPFKWLIEHFWPVPTWPENWEEILYAQRKPRAVRSGMENVVRDSGMAAGNGTETKNSNADSGLRIVSARYGIFGAPMPFRDHSIDVAERVRTLVKNGSLDIVVNNSTLTPNQNPYRGKKKVLLLTYSLDGSEPVTVEREEKDWLIIGPAQNAVAEVESFIAGIGDKVKAMKREREEQLDDQVQSAESMVAAGITEQEIPNLWPKSIAHPPQTAAALNDYLIRRFQISPQRLRGPMPIELRDFHRNDLAQLFAELGFKRGAEIGVAEGNYSEVLLKANPECHLLLVDPWHRYSDNPQGKSAEKHEYAYQETLRKTKGYDVRIVKDYSMEAVREIPPASLDWVYVDAQHQFDYVVSDLIEWSKRVRSGGIVSGDDYYQLDQKRWIGGGVVEAVQAYVNAHRIPIWYIFQGHKSTDFMWVKP